MTQIDTDFDEMSGCAFGVVIYSDALGGVTVVKFVLLSTFVFFGAQAENNKVQSPFAGYNSYVKECMNGKEKNREACETKANEILDRASGNSSDKCDDLHEEHKEAREKASETCSGYVSGDIYKCTEEVTKCNAPDNTSEDAGFSITSILQAVGVPNNGSLSSFNKSCPQFTSKHLDDRLEQLNDEIKDTSERISDIQEKIQEAQDAVQKAQQRAEESRISKEHEVVTGQMDYMAEQREIAARAVEEQHQLESQIDRAHSQMLQAQGEMARALQERNRNLLALKQGCEQQLDEEKARIRAEIQAYRASGRVIKGGLGAARNMKKHYEKRLVSFYSRCVRRAKQQRPQIIRGANDSVKLARGQMRRAQNEMDRLQDAINVRRARAQQEIEEKKARSATLAQQKQREIALDYNKAQQALNLAQTTQNTISSELNKLMQRQQMLEVKVASLKAQDTGREITETPYAVMGALSTLRSTGNEFVEACCPKDGRGHKLCGRVKSALTKYRTDDSDDDDEDSLDSIGVR